MSPVAGRPPRLLGRCQETSRKGGGGTGDLDPKQATLGIEIQVDQSTRTGAQVDDERFGVVGAVCLVWASQIDVGQISGSKVTRMHGGYGPRSSRPWECPGVLRFGPARRDNKVGVRPGPKEPPVFGRAVRFDTAPMIRP